MNERILIDSGPSPRSTHFISTFIHCPQLYAWNHVDEKGGPAKQGVKWPAREPLIRGTLVHTGYAHIFARIRQQQCGLDPDVYYEPVDATEIIAKRISEEGRAQRSIVDGILERCVSIVAAYERECTFFQDRVLYVEDPFDFAITPPGLPDFAGACFRCGNSAPPREVYHTIYECSACGQLLFYCYTRKPDVVIQERSTGIIRTWDHKTMQRVSGRGTRRYAPTVGFIAYDYIGRKLWQNQFGGIVINAVEMATGDTVRMASEPAPEMLRRLPSILHEAELRRRKLLDDRVPAADFPRQANEYVCMTPYGPCDAFDLCLRGGEARAAVEFDPRDTEFEFEGFTGSGAELLTQLRSKRKR